MNRFVIGETEFGIEDGSKVTLSEVGEGVRVDLEIMGNEALYKVLRENDAEGKLSQAPYPPKFYLTGLVVEDYEPFGLRLDEDNLFVCDFALYLGEHFPVVGELRFSGETLMVEADVDMEGEQVKLDISFTTLE